MKNPRARAAQHLAPVLLNQSALNLDSIDIEDPDRGLIAELCYGTLRYLPALELIAQKILRKKLKEKDADILALLLIGLYQIGYLRVADHAAVSETVQAAKQLKKPWATGLLNASLRNYLSSSEDFAEQLSQNPVFSSAHPNWLLKSIQRQWGEHAEDIFTAGNSRPPMTLRVNLARQSREDFLAELKEHNIDAQAGELCKSAVQLSQPRGVHRIPGFAEGKVSVQDEGAQLAAQILAPESGHRVLDACAAPGGKAGHLIEWCEDISLVALDADKSRLEKINQNLKRLSYSAEVIAADANQTHDWWHGQRFDRILIDAPCSGTGVMRRHPDIKTLRTPEDISGFREQQLALLSSLWSVLAPGGRLLYATCSILKSENQDVVSKFAQQQADLSILEIPITHETTATNASIHQCNPGIQLLPMAQAHDGFYYALMAKA